MPRIVLPWYAGEHERFAEDVKLPEPGKRVRVNGGGWATLVSAARVDDERIDLTLDLDETASAY